MHALIEQHRQAIQQLARERGIYHVHLFGSMSRKDATEQSDVDLLVELEDGKSGLALGGLLLDASELLGRPVDVVTQSSLHPRIREKVLKEAIPL